MSLSLSSFPPASQNQSIKIKNYKTKQKTTGLNEWCWDLIKGTINLEITKSGSDPRVLTWHLMTWYFSNYRVSKWEKGDNSWTEKYFSVRLTLFFCLLSALHWKYHFLWILYMHTVQLKDFFFNKTKSLACYMAVLVLEVVGGACPRAYSILWRKDLHNL